MSTPKTHNQKKWYAEKVVQDSVENDGKDCIISFSGGIDSTVLMRLCRDLYPDMKAVFFDTGTEAPETRSFVSLFPNVEWIKPKMSFPKIVKKYGLPLVSKKIAQSISRFQTNMSKAGFLLMQMKRADPKKMRWLSYLFSWHYKEAMLKLKGGNNQKTGKKQTVGKISNKYHELAKSGCKISDECCTYLKKNPGKEYFKGNKVAIIGTKQSDSYGRRQHFAKHRCKAYELTPPQIRPLRHWTDKDVLTYIKENDLKYNKLYDMGADRTGCMPCGFGIMQDPFRFMRLKEQHPNFYKMCMNLGYADALQLLGVFYK